MSHVDQTKRGFEGLPPALYDTLDKVVKLGLPGVGTLYFTIAQIWGLPGGEQVVGTCAALAVFFGLILVISKSFYVKSGAGISGDLVVNESDPEKDVYRLDVAIPFGAIAGKDTITFKVQDETVRE